ncbi:DMT family transporter [Pseudaeromonas paramecii]|uniref:DMT family transporter n=1 Tax=Pseudaeromonas paramecii TaxID=2138166 RepID=A0ABP8QCM1_9GAMM
MASGVPRPHTRLDGLTLLMLLLPPLFWAGNFIVGRAMRDAVPPIALSFDRWVIALICLLPFAWQALRREWRHYWPYRWPILGVSVTGVCAFNVLVYLGLHSTSAANGMLLNSFIPLLVAGLGALLYRQRLGWAQGLGILISFAGVLTIVSRGQWAVLAGLQVAHGDLLVFLATVCWALYTLWLRLIPPQLDRLGLMLVQIVLALILLLPLLLWERHTGAVPHWNREALLAIGYIGIFPSVLAFLLYSGGVARVGAARASLFIHLIPVFGALLSVLLLDESLHLYQLAGMTAIFAGVACANLSRPMPAPHPTKENP